MDSIMSGTSVLGVPTPVLALAPAFPRLGAAQSGRRHRPGAHAGISARVTGEVCPLTAAAAASRDQLPVPFPGTTVVGGPPV
ncbi:MAG: hypothetical protein ACLGIA_12690 [Actinomycetes bacterium]